MARVTLKKAVVRVHPRQHMPTSGQLAGEECIDCRSTVPPLARAGYFYMRSGRARLGWAVSACTIHAGAAR
jgi:hypothetical protein